VSHAWKFKEIAVINPYARVQMNKDRTLNFSDILAAHAGTNAAAVKPEKAAAPLALRIGQVRVEGAKLSVADLTPKKPFRRVIGPVKISVTDFHTDPNNSNPHVFTGSTDTGETFTWGGHFSTDPVGASGELGVENLSLTNFAALYQDFVSFEIRDGVAGFHVNYEFQMSAATNIAAVSNASFTLKSFKLGVPGTEQNLVELPEFAVSGVSGEAFTRRGEVGSVVVRGAELNVTRSKGAEFNVVSAAQANTNASAPGGILVLMGAVTNAFQQLLNSTNLASATVREVAVTDCAVTLTDESLGRPVGLRVDQINVSAKNLSNRPDTNLLTSVSLRWNTNGTFKTDLDASLSPLNADVRLKIEQLELAPLSPYLDSFVNLWVLGSKVGLDGAIRLRTEPGQLPKVTFDGSTGLDDLNLVGGGGGDDLLRWASLRFDGIAANLNPPAVSVTNITLKNFAAHVLIESNGTMNVLSVVRAGETNITPAVPVAAESATDGSAIKRAFAQVKALLGVETNTFAGLPKVEINTVTVEDGELQFTDRSVTPTAKAAVTKINASIQNISTEEMRRAQVRVTAMAGGTGPIEVTGQLNPLNAKQATEAKVSLKHVKLNPADPYTGKFLGYRLTRGELNVDVDYTITASQVKGKNLIVLDQPTLGAKVASTNATKLPVKLGLALLKDSHGKVEINVPVEGNLDDPQFRLGPVIWHVIGNVFVKAISSPFSLLGSLVGGKGGEEMQFQVFAPGSVEITPTAREKLMTLAKALEARPELQVEVEGNVHPELDGEALRRAKVDRQLRLTEWNSLRAGTRTNTTPEQLVIPPDDYATLLNRAYRDASRTNPQLAVLAQAATNVTPTTAASPAVRLRNELGKGAARLLRDSSGTVSASAVPSAGSKSSVSGVLTDEQKMQALMTTVSLTDTDYAALAAKRAKNIRGMLVDELKVNAERVMVSEQGVNAYATNGNRVTLQLR
ncbi:MAG: hypothetical protein RLY20_1741, partial [Verrucomicrobiota bacterium]